MSVGDDDVDYGNDDDNRNGLNDSAAKRQMIREKTQKRAAKSVTRRQLKMGLHHGKLTPLPVNWMYVPMTSLQLVQNWFIGDNRTNIPPLYALDSKVINHLCSKRGNAQGNNVRHKMVAFMKIVQREVEVKDVWIEKTSDWDYRSVTGVWNSINEGFTAKYCSSTRKKEATWTTVYNRMSAATAFNNPRNKANKA